MRTAEFFCNPNKISYSPNFKATSPRDFVIAKHRLVHLAKKGIITTEQLEKKGILGFPNIDILNGLQWGTVLENFSMRKIILGGLKTEMGFSSGCDNGCAYCLHKAKPAAKTELSAMPFNDFKKIINAFVTIMNRANRFLGNKNNIPFMGKEGIKLVSSGEATELAGFYDSDPMAFLEYINGKTIDYTDFAKELFRIGKPILFDSGGYNPENLAARERAKKYSAFFSQPDVQKNVWQFNISINPFNRTYLESFKLGFKGKGKELYDKYIYRIADMLATLGTGDNVGLILRYSTKYEPNMKGMYFSDLKRILKDAEEKCDEILKAEYPYEEYLQKKEKISELISSSIKIEETKISDGRSVCKYAGGYADLFNERNPGQNRIDTRITPKIPDIDAISYKEFLDILKNYKFIIDANGDIYYFYKDYEHSVRYFGSISGLSVTGKKTRKIYNLETRD